MPSSNQAGSSFSVPFSAGSCSSPRYGSAPAGAGSAGTLELQKSTSCEGKKPSLNLHVLDAKAAKA